MNNPVPPYSANVDKLSSLVEIGKLNGTDKHDYNHTFNGLSYLDIYDLYFREMRENPVSLCEIGVYNGASLRTWKQYFQNGNIFGIDIDPRCKAYEEDRIRIAIGSQDDNKFLLECFTDQPLFDIIIDDGSHINSLTLASFEYLFNNRLKNGGIYIIEDLRNSYMRLQTEHNIMEDWKYMQYYDKSRIYDNDRNDLDLFFQDKIKKLDYFQGSILYLHFWSMTCVIKKIT